MLRIMRLLAAATLVVAGAGAALAAEPTETATPDGTLVVPAEPGGEPAALTPLAREVADLRAAFGARLADLTAAYRAAPDATVAAARQREISALKAGLELDLLTLQLRVARERGDAAAIGELEQADRAARARLRADTGDLSPANLLPTTPDREGAR